MPPKRQQGGQAVPRQARVQGPPYTLHFILSLCVIYQNRHRMICSNCCLFFPPSCVHGVFQVNVMYLARYRASTVPGCATGARPSAVAVSRSATSFEAPAEISSSVLSFVSGTIVCARGSKWSRRLSLGWADGRVREVNEPTQRERKKQANFTHFFFVHQVWKLNGTWQNKS